MIVAGGYAGMLANIFGSLRWNSSGGWAASISRLCAWERPACGRIWMSFEARDLASSEELHPWWEFGLTLYMLLLNNAAQ